MTDMGHHSMALNLLTLDFPIVYGPLKQKVFQRWKTEKMLQVNRNKTLGSSKMVYIIGKKLMLEYG